MRTTAPSSSWLASSATPGIGDAAYNRLHTRSQLGDDPEALEWLARDAAGGYQQAGDALGSARLM